MNFAKDLTVICNDAGFQGKGTGKLRDAVQRHLKRCKYVKTYRMGEFGEGDAGVTIAEFK